MGGLASAAQNQVVQEETLMRVCQRALLAGWLLGPMAASAFRLFSLCVCQVLLAVVILSWSYVIYASRVASHWLLEERPALPRQD